MAARWSSFPFLRQPAAQPQPCAHPDHDQDGAAGEPGWAVVHPAGFVADLVAQGRVDLAELVLGVCGVELATGQSRDLAQRVVVDRDANRRVARVQLMVPYSVPKEIVETGIAAVAAARAAVNPPRGWFSASGPSGTVWPPSLIKTTCAGIGSAADAPNARPNEPTAWIAAKIASPVAVDSANCITTARYKALWRRPAVRPTPPAAAPRQ